MKKIKFNISKREGLEGVEGYEATLCEMKVYLHNGEYGWTVTEPRTGFLIYNDRSSNPAKTRKEILLKAENRLSILVDRRPNETIAQMIERVASPLPTVNQ